MRYILFVVFIIPIALFAQRGDAFILSSRATLHTKTANGWIRLDSGWRFQVGDNSEWAKPGFNDSSWQSIDGLQKVSSLAGAPGNAIVWLRLRIQNDSTFTQPLMMRIYQSGASEIYLDGEMIHRFGTVSANPDSAEYFDPHRNNISFPLLNDEEQVLAIRFVNLPIKYPIYFNPRKSFLAIWVTTADIAENDYITRFYTTYTKRLNLVIGAAIILFVLFLSFYLFFPAQKVNLYFSWGVFCFVLFLNFMLLSTRSHGTLFTPDIISSACGMLYLLQLVYCTYKIFNRKLGLIYRTLLALSLASIPFSFLVNGNYIIPFLTIMMLVDALRVTIKSLKLSNKGGAFIMLVCFSANIIFWIFGMLSNFDILPIPELTAYTPFALLLAPLGLAIYLGYSFGMTSQSLRQKLKEVEQLSKEKQEILSAQNEVLERQVQDRTVALNQSLQELKSAQAQLIQSEKMASLGELTAGIAHEIQNPLNFVNNFSEVSNELILEMTDELDKGAIDEAKIIAGDIRQNLEKINHHGRRADSIVKGMLQHSRSSSGIKESTDINQLADEYLRLAYHGLRAKDQSFNATLKTDYDDSIGEINIIPQEIGRVLMNLITNAFYAVDQKKKSEIKDYEPTVLITTKKFQDKFEIRVSDNGVGIPQKVLDKIFQPFFTTKPTGQGTGLGLSLSYDIIKAHGGEIRVETKDGDGADFIITLYGT